MCSLAVAEALICWSTILSLTSERFSLSVLRHIQALRVLEPFEADLDHVPLKGSNHTLCCSIFTVGQFSNNSTCFQPVKHSSLLEASKRAGLSKDPPLV